MTPNKTGWYWFLPDEHCVTPTGLLRMDKPVVLLVGTYKQTRDGDPGPLVVRFPSCTYEVTELTGEWERIEEPKRMADVARSRWGKRREAK